MSVDVHAAPIPRERPKRRSPEARAAAKRSSRRSRAFDAIWIIALLGFLGVVLPVLISSHYGAMGIPRSDDWSYLLTLFRWVDTGELSLNGWVSMTLIGQIVIAAPVVVIAGRSITAVQLFTSMIGLVGLLGVVFIGRQTVRPPWWAVFVAVTIAVGPLWGPLAPTFMTDIPTFTFEMLTLAAAAVAFRRRSLSLPWFAVSIVLGFVGVSIRQYAVVPVIAIVIVAICMLVAEREWRKLRIVLAISAVFAVAAVAIVYWWSGLPDSKSLSPTSPTLHSLRQGAIYDAGFIRLTGLLLLPVVLLAGPVAIARRAWRASSTLTTLLSIGITLWLILVYRGGFGDTTFVGTYITRAGVLSDVVLAGTRPEVIPTFLFDTLVWLASISGLLIVLAAVPFVMNFARRARERELLRVDSPLLAVMALTVTGFAVVYSLARVTGIPVYDRYALPVLPLIAFLVLHSARQEVPVRRSATPRRVWAGVAVVLLAVLGFVYTADSASFDATRWHVAEAATRQGFKPVQVGGGFEWLGWHRQYGPQFRWEGAKVNAEKLGFPLPCVTLVINPPDGLRRKAIVAQGTTSAFGRSPALIIAVRNKQPCVTAKQQRAARP